GRIDFSNLPIFEEDEYQLLKRYLEKNIAYRTGQTAVRQKAVIHNINPWIGALGQNGIRNFSTIVGPENIEYDAFDAAWEDSYMWLYAASSGFHDILFTVTSSEEFANRPLRAVFTNFFGSRFGNYDYENNLLRSALGSGDVLSSCWVGAPHWYFHPMAMGYSLGHSTVTTQNNDIIYSSGNNVKSIHVNLLGDPTLKLYPMQKVENLSAQEQPTFVDLNWTGTTDATGYYVYRKKEGDLEFEVLNVDPILDHTYMDYCPDPDQTYTYMVRGTSLEMTPSGSYNNLSTGAMYSLSTSIDHSPKAAFELIFEEDDLLLLNQSLNTDSISISGIEEVIELEDSRFLLNNPTNGDIITLLAYNRCGVDSTSQEIILSSIEEDQHSLDISVFPNPVYSSLNIKSNEPILRWTLMSYNGEFIKDEKVDSTSISIDVTEIAAGVYLLFVSTTEGEIQRKVFID
ncbi:MAG: T9SS type A sorting domain-containing protein, partial [Bacteroidota bacterium]